MLVKTGAQALSRFRLAKLLDTLQTLHPAVVAVEARYVHLVDLATPLSAEQEQVLDRLLTYGPREGTVPMAAGPQASLLVVPRLGTLSPWASKATDIARGCGLEPVR